MSETLAIVVMFPERPVVLLLYNKAGVQASRGLVTTASPESEPVFPFPGFASADLNMNTNLAFVFPRCGLSLRLSLRLESQSSISEGDGAAAKTAGGKGKKSVMKLSPGAMALWREKGYYEKAQALVAEAKFRSCHAARDVLLKTGNAELVHLVTRRGHPSTEERWIWLERLRDTLRKENKNEFTSPEH